MHQKYETKQSQLRFTQNKLNEGTQSLNQRMLEMLCVPEAPPWLHSEL